MKSLTIFLHCIFATSLLHAGILFDTIIQTPEGPKKIQDLNVGSEVLSVDKDFLQSPKSILTVEENDINFYIEIITENDEILQVSPDQRLFVPYKWVQADQLSLSDVLLNKDATFTRITSICTKHLQNKVFCITVQDNENFFASQNSILLHNGIWGATIGFFTAKFLAHAAAQTMIVLISSAVGLVCPPAGSVVFSSLEYTFLPFIESASNVAGLAGGIAGGTLTGPM